MYDYKKLVVWKRGYDIGLSVYQLVKIFPIEEKYGVAHQLKRASVSIASNIAEGCSRGTQKDFRSFLYIALGSLREVETQLMFARDFGYISEEDFCEMDIKMNEFGAMLSGFIRSVSRNC